MVVLEKFYLTIVLKYMKYYDDVVEFVTVNKKCLEVPKMIHFYPCERKSNQIKELKFKGGQLVLSDDTTFDEIQNMTIPFSLFDLFPNIETLELNGYDLGQPINSNIKLIIKSLPNSLNYLVERKNQIIALKNINLRKWDGLNDTYFKETSKYLLLNEFPNLKYVSFICREEYIFNNYRIENVTDFYETELFGDLNIELQTLVITLRDDTLEKTPEVLKLFKRVNQIKFINDTMSFTRWFNFNKKDLKLIPIAERPKDEEKETKTPKCNIHYQDNNFESLNFTKCTTEPTLSINFGCNVDWYEYGSLNSYTNTIENNNKKLLLPTTKVTRIEMDYCVRKSIIIPKNIVEAKLDNCFIGKIENKCKIQQLEITVNFPQCVYDMNSLTKLNIAFVEIKNSFMKLTTIKHLSFKNCYFEEQKPFSYQLYPSSVTSLKIEKVKNWPKQIYIERLKELEIAQTNKSIINDFVDSKERNKKNGITNEIHFPGSSYYHTEEYYYEDYYNYYYNDNYYYYYEDIYKYNYHPKEINETKIEDEFNLSRCNELNKVILKGMMNYHLPSNIHDLTICDGIILNKEMNRIKHKIERLYVLNVDNIELYFSNLKYLVLINVSSIKTYKTKLNNKLSIIIKKCNFNHTNFEEYLKGYQYSVLNMDYFNLTKIMII